MKKLIIAAAALMVSLAAYGQGSFAFNNRVPPDINAKIQLSTDTTTSSLAGDAYSWQLIGGASGIAQSAAQPLGSGTFRTGAAAGYVNPPANAIVVAGVAGGKNADVWLQIFSGATASGSALGTLGPWTVALTEPPATPNNLPMGTSTLTVTGTSNVPEPSTLALGLLGLGSLLFIRRRS